MKSSYCPSIFLTVSLLVFQNEILVPILKFQEKILIGWLKNNIKFKTIIFLICMCSVAQWRLTLCDPLDCSLPGSSVHGIFQAKVLEWVAISFSRGSYWSRDWTHISCIFCIAGGLFTHWAIWDNTKIGWVEKKKNFHFYQWFERSSIRIKPSGSFSLCFITSGKIFLGS